MLEHLLSGIEIRETLLREALGKAAPVGQVRLFRSAAARGWFDLAYHHYTGGAYRESLRAWLKSQHHAADLRGAKLLIRLLAAWPRAAMASRRTPDRGSAGNADDPDRT